MTTHEINLLIERYLDGTTTPAEERELALAVQQPDAPPEWAIIAEMLGELTTDAALYDTIMAQRTPKPAPRLMKLWPWAAAACIALVMGLSYNYMRHDAPQEIAHTEPPKLPPKVQQAAPVEAPSSASETPLLASIPTEKPPLLERPLEVPDEAPEPPTEAPLLASISTEEPPFHERPLEVPDEAPDEAPDARLYLALLAEVEARALQAEQPELHLYRAIFDEIFVNIEQQSNRPELSL